MTDQTQPPQGPWHPSQPGYQPIQYSPNVTPQTWANSAVPPVTPPPKKPRRFGRIAAIAGGAVALMIVVGTIASSGSETVPTEPAPAVTVTQTPAPAPTVTVSAPPAPAPDPVSYVPQSCIDAIDAAERLDTQWGKVSKVAGDAVEAAYNRDGAAIQKQTRKLDKITPKLKAARSDMETAAAECRDAQ